MRVLIFINAILFSVTGVSMAQVDTINAQNHKLVMSNLKEGKTSYLVYMTDSLETKRTVGDIWERTTAFKKRDKNEVIEFDWKWLHNDSLLATITNICDRKTMSPIYHYASYKRRGVFAYDYKNGLMQPSDTVKNNDAIKKGLVKLDIPIISWEQDLETYPLLPIKRLASSLIFHFLIPMKNQQATIVMKWLAKII